MPETIFALPRHKYQSYTDFWALVRLSGYPTCYVDEIDFQSRNMYITTPMNGDYRAHLANHKNDRKCTLIHWMLERPETSVIEFASANQELVTNNLVDINICSDPAMARHTGAHYVPMGSHAALGQPGEPHEKRFDAIGLMAYTGRRGFLFERPGKMKKAWNGITLAPNAWGVERDRLLRASRFAINIHKDAFKYCEPLRFAVFVAYGLPVISEIFAFNTSLYGLSFTFFDHLEQLDEDLSWIKRNLDRMTNEAFEVRRALTETWSFRACIERYL